MAKGSNKGMFNLLLSVFKKFAEFKAQYIEIKSNEELKRSSTKFAKKSIGYSVAGIFTFALMAAFIYWGNLTHDSAVFIVGWILIAVGIVGMIYPLMYMMVSLNAMIKQLKLNRKFAGWLALIVWLGVLVTIIIVVIKLLNSLSL